MIKYVLPTNWIKYDPLAIVNDLIEAKAAVKSLIAMPYQRSWVEQLQIVQLKREIAGTSRIEGADFTEKELDEALKESPEQLRTRSQRQAAACKRAYQWIADSPDDRPIDEELIYQIHRRIITGADDDHCPPGKLRAADQNVSFGTPRHRGVDGGPQCASAFEKLMENVQSGFPHHDHLIQALALHYHLAAMHPFLDGNGRTARAVEALMLQRAGLRDSLFIAMSNYYYEEKNDYLGMLSQVRANGHDLTPFLIFGLKGIALQCQRLLDEIRTNVSKALFRDVMHDLFNRMVSKRKRVIAKRQIEILKILLDADMSVEELRVTTQFHYAKLKTPGSALVRDLLNLISLGALREPRISGDKEVILSINLEWPRQITETEFFRLVQEMPKAKTQLLRLD
ncbi:MAG: Fic family protein [Candidatus Marinimicrobia bacterium]|nr:Fic family protein [Candidatus Neomarinimicrobiota bacterium]